MGKKNHDTNDTKRKNTTDKEAEKKWEEVTNGDKRTNEGE